VPAAAPYGYGAPPPPAAPVPLEDNPDLSSSQRESLEEAREDYEEAQRKVAEEGSSASSSDIEDLQEAREEYHSEVESAHEELED
jgi:multidrug resistance efflux pump